MPLRSSLDPLLVLLRFAACSLESPAFDLLILWFYFSGCNINWGFLVSYLLPNNLLVIVRSEQSL